MGVPAGAVLLACVLYVLIRRKTKGRRKVPTQEPKVMEDAAQLKSELPGESALHEADATPIEPVTQELPSPHRPIIQQIHELP